MSQNNTSHILGIATGNHLHERTESERIIMLKSVLLTKRMIYCIHLDCGEAAAYI